MDNLFLIFKLLSVILAVILSLIAIFSKLNKRSLENIKKRYEYYKEIIISIDNKVLAYTGLKEYLGFSISDKFAEYILKSTKFYDIVTVLKLTHIEFDPITNKNIYIKNARRERRLFVFLYLFFLVPFILFLSFIDKIIALHKEYLIASIILVIPWTILAIYYAIEASNRTLVINLLEKMNNE